MEGCNYPWGYQPYNPGLNQTLLPPHHPEYNDFDRLLYGEISPQDPHANTIPRSHPQPEFDQAQQLQSPHNDASYSYAGSSTPQAGSLPPELHHTALGEEPPDYGRVYDTSHMDVSEGEDDSLISSNQHESTLPTSFPSSAVGGSDNERQEFVRRKNQVTSPQQQYPTRDATVGIGAALQYHSSPRAAPTMLGPHSNYPPSSGTASAWDAATMVQMDHIRPTTSDRHENISVSRSPSTRSKKNQKTRQPRKVKRKEVPSKAQRQALKAIKTEVNEDPHFLSPTSAISRSSESGHRYPPAPTNDERKHLEALLRNNSVDLICHWLNVMGPSSEGSEESHTPHPGPSENYAQFEVGHAACRINADQKSANRARQSDERRFGCTCGCGETFGTKWNWQRHEETNVFDWPCQVPGCYKIFPRRDKVLPHMSRDHRFSPSDLKPCPQNRYGVFRRHCGLCGEMFLEPAAFIDHVAKHWERKIGGPCTMEEWQWEWPLREVEMDDGDNGDGGDDDDDDSNDGDNDQSDNNNDRWGSGPSYEHNGGNDGAGPSNHYSGGSQAFHGPAYGLASGPSFGPGGYGHYNAHASNATRGRSRTRSDLIQEKVNNQKYRPFSLRKQDQGVAVRSSKLESSTRYEKFLIEGVSARNDYREAVDDHCQTLLHSFTEPSLERGLSSTIQQKRMRRRSRPSSAFYIRDVSNKRQMRKPLKILEFGPVTPKDPKSRSRSMSRSIGDVLETIKLIRFNAICSCQCSISDTIQNLGMTVSCPNCKRVICHIHASPSVTPTQMVDQGRDLSSSVPPTPSLQVLQQAVWKVILVKRATKILRKACRDRRQGQIEKRGDCPKEWRFGRSELCHLDTDSGHQTTHRQAQAKEHLEISERHVKSVNRSVSSVNTGTANSDNSVLRNQSNVGRQQTQPFESGPVGCMHRNGCPVQMDLGWHEYAKEEDLASDPVSSTSENDTYEKVEVLQYPCIHTIPGLGKSHLTDAKVSKHSFKRVNTIKRHLTNTHGVEHVPLSSRKKCDSISGADEQLRMLETLAAFLINSNVDPDTIRYRLSHMARSHASPEQERGVMPTHSSDTNFGYKDLPMKPSVASLPQLLMSMNLRSTNKVKRFVQRTLSDCLEGAVTECELVLDLPRIRSHVTAKALINGMNGQIHIAMQLSTGASVLTRFISSSFNRFTPSERLKEIARNSDLRIDWTGDDITSSYVDEISEGHMRSRARMFQDIDKHVSHGGPILIHDNAVARPLQLLTGMCGFHLQHALPISGTEAMKPASLEESISSPKSRSSFRSRFRAMPGRLRQWRKKRSHSEIN